jgi:hypothetical protein
MPTVSARGDPHLVNLRGEHFDINHGGEFTLLRIPQATGRTAELALQASISPEHGRPCTTYIAEVQLSGTMLGGRVVQVRSYRRAHAAGEANKFLGLRVQERAAPPEAQTPWQEFDQWADGDHILFEQESTHGVRVTMSKTQWHSKKSVLGSTPTVAGQLVFWLQRKRSNVSATIITVRQDLPGQEHLDLVVRRVSALGRYDVGGLLGFDAHPDELEEVTPECERHREGLDGRKGPRFARPGWKARWEKIREGRRPPRPPGSAALEDEVAASLRSDAMMCVCPTEAASASITEDEYWGRAIAGEVEGVVARFQVGRLAEATWD